MAGAGRDPLDDEGLTLRGSIEDTSVPDLLKSVLSSGETGVLTFRKGDVTKSVHLHMGRHEFEEMEYTQIAKTMECSIGTVSPGCSMRGGNWRLCWQI